LLLSRCKAPLVAEHHEHFDFRKFSVTLAEVVLLILAAIGGLVLPLFLEFVVTHSLTHQGVASLIKKDGELISHLMNDAQQIPENYLHKADQFLSGSQLYDSMKE
jgi:hypothetical protein